MFGVLCFVICFPFFSSLFFSIQWPNVISLREVVWTWTISSNQTKTFYRRKQETQCPSCSQLFHRLCKSKPVSGLLKTFSLLSAINLWGEHLRETGWDESFTFTDTHCSVQSYFTSKAGCPGELCRVNTNWTCEFTVLLAPNYLPPASNLGWLLPPQLYLGPLPCGPRKHPILRGSCSLPSPLMEAVTFLTHTEKSFLPQLPCNFPLLVSEALGRYLREGLRGPGTWEGNGHLTGHIQPRAVTEGLEIMHGAAPPLWQPLLQRATQISSHWQWG